MTIGKIIKASLGGLMAFGLVSQASAADDGDHSYNQHTIGIFGGATSGNGHTDFTFGGEYEFRFDEMWGVGGIFEHSPNAHGGDGVSVYMGQVHLHPYKGWRFSGGIGQEKIHGTTPHKDTIYRLGAAYDFHVENFGIAPTVNLDFVGGHQVVVFGIAISKGF